MALIRNPRGREEELVGIEYLEGLFDVPFGVVAALVNRGLFPEPVHMKPPLWARTDIVRWQKRAGAMRHQDVKEAQQR